MWFWIPSCPAPSPYLGTHFTFDPEYVDALMDESRKGREEGREEKNVERVGDESDDLSTYSTQSIYTQDEESEMKEA